MSQVLRLQHTSIPMPAAGREAARAFYGGALGMAEVRPPSTLDVERLVWFRAGIGGHEIHLYVDEAMARQSCAAHLCLEVDDVAAYRERFRAAGIAIEETIEIVNRPRFNVRDPFDNLIEVTQITGEYS